MFLSITLTSQKIPVIFDNQIYQNLEYVYFKLPLKGEYCKIISFKKLKLLPKNMSSFKYMLPEREKLVFLPKGQFLFIRWTRFQWYLHLLRITH